MKHDVNDAALPPGPATEPASLEDLQHRDIVWQNFRNQFLEPRAAGDRDEMAQQRSANALSLVLVHYCKSDFPGCTMT